MENEWKRLHNATASFLAEELVSAEVDVESIWWQTGKPPISVMKRYHEIADLLRSIDPNNPLLYENGKEGENGSRGI